ncbi:Proteasomal ATPase-associated factor 1 [Lamellibrachia satsuma]|nr:Proteasomal ATPase-associated factor 1 [Lamellibrachia satsuma]
MADKTGKARIIVQADWDQVLQERCGTAWVAFRKPDKPGIYGELKSHGVTSSGFPKVSSADGFNVESTTRDCGTVHRCSFLAPVVTYYSVHGLKKSVVDLAVTPGGLAVSCDSLGKMKVWTTDKGEVRRDLDGHLGDVYSCRFFPSGVVILSGSADMRLKIWSAETGQCAATLVGHQGGVNDTAIVDRGRNVVSVSSDGTARLWDCGSQTCLSVVSAGCGVIGGCAVGAPLSGCLPPAQPADEKEVGTDGKMLLLACDNGHLLGHALQGGEKIFDVSCCDAVNCCTFVSDTLVVCGTQDGHIYLVDIRNTGVPLKIQSENRSAILSLLPSRQGVYISTGDGSCFYQNQHFETVTELTGPDIDSVYRVATDGCFLYTSSRDGTVRKYICPSDD